MTSAHPNCRVLWCGAAISLVLCSTGACAVGARNAATHTVVIDASRFEPEVLTVDAGDSVIWANKDIVAHTATSQTRGFDSGNILPGETWHHKFDKTGEFAYTCTYHPTMKGTVRVK
jgi:plastocyanin